MVGFVLRKGGICSLFVSIVLVVFVYSQASASIIQDPINWGSPVGMTVKYFNISEDSDTDPIYDGGGNPVGLYREPTVFQDSLKFNDLYMFSSSTGVDSDITDAFLTATIEAKPNSYIDKINFKEWGDLTLTGLSGEALASIGNVIYITILEIEGVGAVNFNLEPIHMVVSSEADGEWLLSENGRVTAEVWSGDLLVDLTQEIRDLGYLTGNVLKLYFKMDNTLTTASMAGTSAFIAKKETNGFNLEIEPTIVPEPTTIVLLGFAALGLLRKRRA